jgi:hypothetical protein
MRTLYSTVKMIHKEPSSHLYLSPLWLKRETKPFIFSRHENKSRNKNRL